MRTAMRLVLGGGRPLAVARALLASMIAAAVGIGLMSADNAEAQAQAQAVGIQGFAFSPASLTVPVGTSITWTNRDTAPHTATATSGAQFNSGTLQNGGTFAFTPATAGTIAYRCDIHPQMTATLTVTAAQQAPAGQAPAAGQQQPGAAPSPGRSGAGSGNPAPSAPLAAAALGGAALMAFGGGLALLRRPIR